MYQSRPRIVNVAHLYSLDTSTPITVLNTHFDHIGQKSKAESAHLILNSLAKMVPPDRLTILLGDFNSQASDDAYQILTQHYYRPGNTCAKWPWLPWCVSTPRMADVRREVRQRKPSGRDSASLHHVYGETHTNPCVALTHCRNCSHAYDACNLHRGFSGSKLKPKTVDYIFVYANAAFGSSSPVHNSHAWQTLTAKWCVEQAGVQPNKFEDGLELSDHRMVVASIESCRSARDVAGEL